MPEASVKASKHVQISRGQPMNPMATDNPQRDVIDAALAGDIPACIERLSGILQS